MNPSFRFLSPVLLGCLALALQPASALAWWDSAWPLRKPITIDTSADGAAIAAPIGAAPVLIRLHEGNFQFAAAKPDGTDLRFVAEDDKTPLVHHIEKFDPVLNEAYVWVRLPDAKPSAKTTLWLYFGNATEKATRVEDAKGTYDAATSLVYHFSENGQPAFDFSQNGNNAQAPGLPADGALISTGLRLDGRSAVTIPASGTLAWSGGGALTWSAWVKPAAPQPKASLFTRRDGGKAFVIGLDSGVPFVEITSSAGVVRSAPGAAFAAGQWRHLAVIAEGAKISLFADGELYATVLTSLPELNVAAVLGGEAATGVAGFAGELDELTIANVARTAGYVKFAAFSQGGERSGKLTVYGGDEEDTNWMSAFKEGYMGVIIGSLTFDGWLVIGILVVMAIISWAVMVKKGTYLGKIGKGNEQFLKEWSHVANDLSVLDAAEDAKTMGGRVDAASHRMMRNSSLYKIYHIGVEEIRHRLSADNSGASKVLSSRSIQAIRASLDGGLVRETQRLNSNMVLLTIAISGGPFLGLLGTVVGVMITFAAVAAAGEVNVNAIAPGIAAALAATVAGLAVAIPALFGYNYLLTKIKMATTDMHVFIDEFVTKLAEFYSEPSSS